jgi:hypothetical protein
LLPQSGPPTSGAYRFSRGQKEWRLVVAGRL